MLLLYHISGHRQADLSGIYIPLCFYFILRKEYQNAVLELFTFHYASTLSNMRYEVSVLYNNLHSTMLLLYPSCTHCMPLGRFIYIPLCFYFIGGAYASETQDDKFTFHYASTLSIRNDNILYQLDAFTFHYASTLSRNGGAGPVDGIIFTFHYASTLSIRKILAATTGIAFTFHYASTLSKHRPPEQMQGPHLHSTMLLLYQIYQPGNYFRRHNLHSTMLLLYRMCCVIDRTERGIYIPLCFYFIPSRQEEDICPPQIYIPLCFYFIYAQHYFDTLDFTFTFHYASTLSEIGL